MNYYYADAQNQPVGPCTAEQMQLLYQQGTLHDDTWVIEEGETEWKLYPSLLSLPVDDVRNATFPHASPGSKLAQSGYSGLATEVPCQSTSGQLEAITASFEALPERYVKARRARLLIWFVGGLFLMGICSLVLYFISGTPTGPPNSLNIPGPGGSLVRAADVAQYGIVMMIIFLGSYGGELAGFIVVCSSMYGLLSGPPKARKNPSKSVQTFFAFLSSDDDDNIRDDYLITLSNYVSLTKEARQAIGELEGFTKHWADTKKAIKETAMEIPVNPAKEELLKSTEKHWTNPVVTSKVKITGDSTASYEVVISCKVEFWKYNMKDGQRVSYSVLDEGEHVYHMSGQLIRIDGRWYFSDGHWSGALGETRYNPR